MELQTGGNAATMTLELYDKNDKLVAKLDDDNALLGSYPVDSGMRLHVGFLVPPLEIPNVLIIKIISGD